MPFPYSLPDLVGQAQALRATVTTSLQPQTPAVLNYRPAPTTWSALECLEHLNRYGRYYLPVLAAAVASPVAGSAPGPMRFSWLGRKSYELVRPENRKKHSALARLNPSRSHLLAPVVVHEFLKQVDQLVALLTQARHTDLNRKAVPVEFCRLLKLRTGEALLFVLAHAQRHVAQAGRAVAEAPPGTA